jgi:hypothetical protein
MSAFEMSALLGPFAVRLLTFSRVPGLLLSIRSGWSWLDNSVRVEGAGT